MYFDVINSNVTDNKLVVAVNIGIALFIFLIGCISSRRFNFLHGFISMLTMMFVVAGISSVMSQITGGKDIQGLSAFLTEYNKYTFLTQLIPFYIYDFIVLILPDLEIIQSQPWIVYLAIPLALWIVSRVFAGIIRNSRRRYY